MGETGAKHGPRKFTAILNRVYEPWRGADLAHVEAYLRDPYRKERKKPRRERRMARRLRARA